MLQVFESHAEVIGYDTFMLCSLPYLKQIVQKVKEKLGPDAVPMVWLYQKNWQNVTMLARKSTGCMYVAFSIFSKAKMACQSALSHV